MLENMKPPVKRPPCKVRSIMDDLDTVDRDIFAQAVDSVDGWSALTLSSELRRRGIYIGAETIRTHRRGECSC